MNTSNKQNILMTSLDEIKSFDPCKDGWKNILKGRNKKESDSELFKLVECLESNTIHDVCWLLGERKAEISICVKFAKMCADSVRNLKNIYADYADYAAAAAADYAADSDSAAAAAAAADSAAAAADARQKQEKLNRQFLTQCINEYSKSV